MRIFLVFLKTHSCQLGISEQVNCMPMPNFLLAVFVKFRKNYFGWIQQRKGRERKSLPHTSPAPSRKGEKSESEHQLQISYCNSECREPEKNYKLDGYNPYHISQYPQSSLSKEMSPVYCRWWRQLRSFPHPAAQLLKTNEINVRIKLSILN